MQASSPGPAHGARAPQEVAVALLDAVESALRGASGTVRLALVALLSGGHLLVEGVPGTGKTLLAKSLAASIGGRFGRVQCTPDLLPADVTGTSVYGPRTGEWEFRAGPIFANVVLVDEVNRASPRTQAALLEPMEEHQVSIDGETHPLPDPFFLVATQNPFGSAGTFQLPDSQLDRFALVATLGRPDREAEREILTGTGGVDALAAIEPVTSPVELASTIAAVRHVHCAHSVLDYVLDVVAATRTHPAVALGASPRASLGLLHAARAHATVMNRDFVSPDDVKAVAPAALGHRITPATGVDVTTGTRIVAEIVGVVTSPTP
ncbi:MAG: MoxR family ATPase [Actinomycetota bacterium]|nr:MoxR family ATPase [Actinomycetota bacterium]